MGAKAPAPVILPSEVVPSVPVRQQINYVTDCDKEIIGMERAKRSLDATLSLPLKFPSFCAGNQTVRSLLLWGPPGTGKTMLAKAFAAASNKKLLLIDPGNIMSAYWGQTAKKFKEIFDGAISDAEGKVIFMDELDAFGRDRSSKDDSSFMRQIFTQLLQSLQDLINADQRCKSIFIGCTNTVKDLDPALRRRFSQLIFCDIPNADERFQLLKKGIPDVERDESLSDEVLERVAGKMDLFSGSDIARVINYVREAPMLEIQKAKFFRENNDSKWEPCTEGVSGAQNTTLRELPADSLGTRRRCNQKDLDAVMISYRPNLTREMYDKFLKELNEIGGGDLSSRIQQVDQRQRSLGLEESSPEAREIDLILYKSDLSKLKQNEYAEEVTNCHQVSNYLKAAEQIQKFIVYAQNPGSNKGVCKQFFTQVKVPVFVGLLLSGFIPNLIWLLVAVTCCFMLLNVVVIPFYSWWLVVKEGGDLTTLGLIAEDTKEFVIFFTVSLIICHGKYVVVTNFALLDSFVLTWTMVTLQNLIAGLVGYAVFNGSSIVLKRKDFHQNLVDELQK
jgi:hypothetical protein